MLACCKGEYIDICKESRYDYIDKCRGEKNERREKTAGHRAGSDDGDLEMRNSSKNIGNCQTY